MLRRDIFQNYNLLFKGVELSLEKQKFVEKNVQKTFLKQYNKSQEYENMVFKPL